MKNNIKSALQPQSGRSMIEMLGVLAIIGVLSVGGIAGYSKAMNKYRTNKVADNISMIVTNIRTLYAQQTNFNGLDNSTAIDMGVIPDELGTDSASGTLTNVFNGSVYVNAVYLGNTAQEASEKAFQVTFNGLSKEACVTLATNDWGSNYSSGLVAIEAANAASGLTKNSMDDSGKTEATTHSWKCTGTKTGGDSIACPGGSVLETPMNVATAAAACACGTDSTCAIALKFY
jgi:Tfp pilus assembly protein PilE